MLVLATVAFAADAAPIMGQGGEERAYFSAVARYFQIPEAEIAILGNWDLPSDEIPVVLFVARRAGVSAEALVALRESGRSWPELGERFGIGARQLHVPLSDPGSAGALESVYERFRVTPVEEWGSIGLTGADVVALVNVRVLSQVLGVPPDDVTRRIQDAESFVELYGRLIR